MVVHIDSSFLAGDSYPPNGDANQLHTNPYWSEPDSYWDGYDPASMTKDATATLASESAVMEPGADMLQEEGDQYSFNQGSGETGTEDLEAQQQQIEQQRQQLQQQIDAQRQELEQQQQAWQEEQRQLQLQQQQEQFDQREQDLTQREQQLQQYEQQKLSNTEQLINQLPVMNQEGPKRGAISSLLGKEDHTELKKAYDAAYTAYANDNSIENATKVQEAADNYRVALEGADEKKQRDTDIIAFGSALLLAAGIVIATRGSGFGVASALVMGTGSAVTLQNVEEFTDNDDRSLRSGNDTLWDIGKGLAASYFGVGLGKGANMVSGRAVSPSGIPANVRRAEKVRRTAEANIRAGHAHDKAASTAFNNAHKATARAASLESQPNNWGHKFADWLGL